MEVLDRLNRLLRINWALMKMKLSQASFIDDLGADSLDIVEMIMAFEEERHGDSR